MIEVIRTADDCVELSVFTSDIDIVAMFGKPAQHIYVVDAGTGTRQLVVICAGSKGVPRSYTAVTGWAKDLKVTKILSATTVLSVQVAV